MKQIVDKLNKIAKKINENVELSDRDLIIDSLDSITKAYGGTPNDSTLIVDKLDDIYNNIGSGGGGGTDNLKRLTLKVHNLDSDPLRVDSIISGTTNLIFDEITILAYNTNARVPANGVSEQPIYLIDGEEGNAIQFDTQGYVITEIDKENVEGDPSYYTVGYDNAFLEIEVRISLA